jgi:hypothetical protein
MTDHTYGPVPPLAYSGVSSWPMLYVPHVPPVLIESAACACAEAHNVSASTKNAQAAERRGIENWKDGRLLIIVTFRENVASLADRRSESTSHAVSKGLADREITLLVATVIVFAKLGAKWQNGR